MYPKFDLKNHFRLAKCNLECKRTSRKSIKHWETYSLTN